MARSIFLLVKFFREDSATLDMAKSDTLMKIQNVDGDDGRDDDKGMQDHASSG